jgi:aspartate 1-decarboxylase
MESIRMLRAKLHGIRVTDANLAYQGSVTLDPEHCEAAGIYPLEFVEIWNKASGVRLSTYVLPGTPGSSCCILNGAAARTCQRGDELIICTVSTVAKQELLEHKPRVVIFREDNTVERILQYDVFSSPSRKYDFRIRELERDVTQGTAASKSVTSADLGLAGVHSRLVESGWCENDINSFLVSYFR